MARKIKPRGRWTSRFHFLTRFLGLTGLLLAGLGALVASVYWNRLPGWESLPAFLQGEKPGDVPLLEAQIVAGVIAGGLILVVLAALVELIGTLFFVAGRRSAPGPVAMVPIGLAAVLLLGLNVFPLQPPLRFASTPHLPFTPSPEP